MKALKKKIKHLLKAILRSKLIYNLIGYIAFVYVWFVGKTSTCDISPILKSHKDAQETDGAIIVIWHGRALMLPYFMPKGVHVKALVSPHNDGRIIARLLNCFGLSTIDGSSNEHASRAALEIYKELSSGSIVAIIPDGPRGPRMRLNKSVIYFAKKTGKPIIGLTYSSKGAKVLHKSWDAMMLPKPFTNIILKTTDPIFIPKNLKDEELEQTRKSVEDELNTITLQADKLCDIEEIEIGYVRKKKHATPQDNQ